MTVLLGPDVSQFQGRPNWRQVAASHPDMEFAWYKATEGRTHVDPSCAYNREAIPAAGLIAGAYHFLYYSAEYANNPALWGAQAENFVKAAGRDHGHVLDVEAAAASGHWLGVREWVAAYRRLLPGHPLGVYTNRGMWNNRSRMPYPPTGLFDYAWHAGYRDGQYIPTKGSLPAQWAAASGRLSNSLSGAGYPGVDLWQITDHAAVPGVPGTCDGNAYTGTRTEYQALLTGTAGTTQPPTEDSMSAAEVADLKQFIRQSLAGYVDDIARASGAAVHTQQLFRAEKPDGTPLTIGDVLLGEYQETPLSAGDVRKYVDEILERLPAPQQEQIRGQLRAIGDQVRVQLADTGGGGEG